MTNYRWKSLGALVILAGVSISSEAAAARAYVDGPATSTEAYCPWTGEVTRGTVTRVGMWVDPVTSFPKLNEVTVIHAVATNTNCIEDDVGFEFFLPAGASLAISSINPVKCFIGNGQGTTGSASFCQAQPTLGNSGGLYFGYQPNLAPGWSYEVQIPIVFNQTLVNSPLLVRSWTDWGWFDSSVGVSSPYQSGPIVQPKPGWTRGDDLALIGGSLAGETLPVAFSNDDGTFNVTNHPVGDFAAFARTPNVKRLSGDFNHDGHMDYALVGGAGWQSIPVAMSLASGKFTITNAYVGDFGTFAAQPGVTPVVGDFDRDGDADIALTGGANWTRLPIAFSSGDGSFTKTNLYIGQFATWAAAQGARPVAGDFNRDGKTDIALVGGPAWASIPIAFSNGNGTFNVTNERSDLYYLTIDGGYVYWNFAEETRRPNAQILTGDFNKDGCTDLALVGGKTSTKIETAMSRCDGRFTFGTDIESQFAIWAATPGVKIHTGDFNRDGYTDLALTGGANWRFLPVAMSRSGGNFDVTNWDVGDFGVWASTPGVRALVGDYNGDGFSDIALTGGVGWASIPVAFSRSAGFFNISNAGVSFFPSWSAEAAATVIAGRTHY